MKKTARERSMCEAKLLKIDGYINIHQVGGEELLRALVFGMEKNNCSLMTIEKFKSLVNRGISC